MLAGAADADADAAEQALEAGTDLPSPMPSAALSQRLTLAGAAVKRAERLHARSEGRLADTFRAEAPAWRAAELAVAEQDEAEVLDKLADLIAAYDRARGSRAVAGWVGRRLSRPETLHERLSGPIGTSGEKLLRRLVEDGLGISQRRTAAAISTAQHQAAAATAAAEAERLAAIEQRQRDHDRREAAEARNTQRYLDRLDALVEGSKADDDEQEG